MFKTEVYKYRKDGFIYVGGELPENAEVIGTMIILNADENKLLKSKTSEETMNSILLSEEISEEDFEEIEQKDEKHNSKRKLEFKGSKE